MVSIVGIDCATDPRRVGLAFGSFTPGRSVVEQVQLGSSHHTLIDAIAEWVEGKAVPSLFALDAPLGWPAPLARALQDHVAGEMLDAQPNDLFRRATDRHVRQTIGKQTLDVGADRIARTAYAALKLIGDLRLRLSSRIPLAWHPELTVHSAIEVYPAATLLAHGINPAGYKAAKGRSDRERIVKELGSRICIDVQIPQMETNSDGLDAVVCALAAADLLANTALPSKEDSPVVLEGWIWFRNPWA